VARLTSPLSPLMDDVSGGAALSRLSRLPPLQRDCLAARMPSWNPADLAHRQCPLCGRDNPVPVCLRPDGLPVVTCKICGMTYVAEAPSRESLEEFYGDYGRHKGYRARRLPRWQCHVERLLSPYCSILEETGGIAGFRIAEVGCSFGRFLQVVRAKGADVTGIELDEGAARFLSSIGIRNFRSVGRSEHDVICAFQLIEHLSDPASFVEAASKCLQEGGRFLLSLPNGAGLEEVGAAWIGFRVDLEHINYFTCRTLADLLAMSGLYIEHYWENGQPGISRGMSQFSAFIRRGLAPLFHSPTFDDGTYVLTVLARKGPEGSAAGACVAQPSGSMPWIDTSAR
jgi:SAM-dependent methyltransferase